MEIEAAIVRRTDAGGYWLFRVSDVRRINWLRRARSKFRRTCGQTGFRQQSTLVEHDEPMELFDLAAALITLAAVFSYINHRWLKLPTTIGLMVIALLFSLGLVLAGGRWPLLDRHAEQIIGSIDFNETLMQGMLGMLLFAGAMHVDLGDLTRQKWAIGTLATVGVLLSTALIGLAAWGVFHLLGLPVRLIYCLLFGALISPTDPIAVLAILKQAATPKELEIKITGESLFNDGVGVVIFLGLLEIATGEHGFDPLHLGALFLQEAVGGAVFGLAIGYIAFRMLRSVDQYSVEILISLAVASGGYALANSLHLSGPIAMVVAGLLIGNHGRQWAMSSTTCEHLDTFWELIDEILNAVLFVLIGLELVIIKFNWSFLQAGLLMIPVVLLARLIAVGLPVKWLRRRHSLHPHATSILTWGGLRGGISVALALSIPAVDQLGQSVTERSVLLAVTYIVVVFSVIVQGLTIGKFVRWRLGVQPVHELPVPPFGAEALTREAQQETGD
ncbi:MAG: cation:proton antiporter [Planctomycetaceae bacterium]